jgi:sugar phosphate permease
LSGTDGAIRNAFGRLGLKPFAAADVEEWRGGWRIVAGAAVGLGTGISLYLMLSSLFIAGFTKEFGWSRGDLGTAGAFAFIIGAVSLSVVGKIIDRVGFRPIVMVCAPALALLYIMMALQPGTFWFYLLMMLWGGVFGAGTGAIAYTRPVVAAFVRQRGLALGVATCGVSVTSMAVAPMLSEVIDAHGWRAGLYALAVVTTVIGLPVALILIASAREARARATDEIPNAAHVIRGDEVPDAAALHVPDVTIGQAMRMPAFWLIVAALFCVNVPGSGLLGQLSPMISDKGFSVAATGYVMSIYAFGLLSGRLATGFALDRFSPTFVAGVMTIVPAIGMSLLLIPTPSFAVAGVAVLMIGLQQGSEVDLIAYFVSRRFGVANYGAIYGRVATFGAVGTAVGLALFGWVHTATGTYQVALVIGAAAFAVGAGAFVALGRVR